MCAYSQKHGQMDAKTSLFPHPIGQSRPDAGEKLSRLSYDRNLVELKECMLVTALIEVLELQISVKRYK